MSRFRGRARWALPADSFGISRCGIGFGRMETSVELVDKLARRAGRAPRSRPLVIESCNSTWLFDAERHRFRRVPRGSSLDLPPPASDWQSYFALEMDPPSEAFTVVLNEAGTRLLRSWRHGERCEQCGTVSTAELTCVEVGAPPQD